MGHFPMFLSLAGANVLLVGEGKQTNEKEKRLLGFGANLIHLTDLTKADLLDAPALVIVGDLDRKDAERISRLCQENRIPVNVVDVPELCTFYFPALVQRGDMTIAISTGGKSPAVASYMRSKVENIVPDSTEEILSWIAENRAWLKERNILTQAIEKAFELERPLTMDECIAMF